MLVSIRSRARVYETAFTVSKKEAIWKWYSVLGRQSMDSAKTRWPMMPKVVNCRAVSPAFRHRVVYFDTCIQTTA
jgi:hypothetical protein